MASSPATSEIGSGQNARQTHNVLIATSIQEPDRVGGMEHDQDPGKKEIWDAKVLPINGLPRDEESSVLQYIHHTRRQALEGSDWAKYFGSVNEEVDGALDAIKEDVAAFGTSLPGSPLSAEASCLRAPSIRWLISFTERHGCWEWPTWRVVAELVIPATKDKRCRFADLDEHREHFGLAQTFVSHCWSANWGTIVAAVSDFNDHSRHVWIDCFSVRQWPGNRADLVFAGVIEKCSSFLLVCESVNLETHLDIHQIIAQRIDLLPEQVRYVVAFFRAWCLLEIMTAIHAPGVVVIMKFGEMIMGEESDGGCDIKFRSMPCEVYNLSLMVDIGQAEAKVPADLAMVLGEVDKMFPGGRGEFNSEVRKIITASRCSMSAPEVQSWACGDRTALRLDAGEEGSGGGPSYDELYAWAYAAAGSGYLELLSALLSRGVDASRWHEGPGPQTLLGSACISGQVECAKCILASVGDAQEKRAAVVDLAGGQWGDSPLTAAAGMGHIDVVELLLAEGGNPNQTRTSGNGPLVDATSGGFHHIMDILLSYGADPDMTNAKGKGAVHYAAQSCDVNALEVLIRHGARASGDGGATLGGLIRKWASKSSKAPNEKGKVLRWLDQHADFLPVSELRRRFTYPWPPPPETGGGTEEGSSGSGQSCAAMDPLEEEATVLPGVAEAVEAALDGGGGLTPEEAVREVGAVIA